MTKAFLSRDLMELLSKGGFWLGAISLGVLVAERLAPWRRDQRVLRPLWLQDVFWFAFNAYLLGLFAGPVFAAMGSGLGTAFRALFGAGPGQFRVLGGLPLWAQVAVALVTIDFVEWLVHNLLHRVSVLWKFHRVHHSITTMDWIGNFRFHPIEIFIYSFFKYIPMALLGASSTALLIMGSFAVLIGNLNHSNLDISWGPLRYVLNSPRMHLWHHEARVRNRAGVNFAVVFSLWDWLFKTAYMPAGKTPDRIGFKGDDRFPTALWWRFLLPFMDRP